MILIGKFNILDIKRKTSVGLFLADDMGEEVLLPEKYVPEDVEVDDKIVVFVYRDSYGRLVATTLKPHAKLHEFAYLQVKQITKVGAFLEWGLEKDLIVPFREQAQEMVMGEWYVVFIYIDDETDRLVASSRLNRFFENEKISVEEGEKVELLVYQITDLGVKVVINDFHQGLIYRNQIFKNINIGDRLEGFVHLIREDGKIDVSLEAKGHLSIGPNARTLIEVLKKAEGFLPLTDKSPPELIKNELEMSKKAFKRAVGVLYKSRLITIESQGIRLKKGRV